MKKVFILAFFLTISLFPQPLTHLDFSRLDYPLNTFKDDYNPIISPSSKYLILQSNRVGGKGNFDIWLVENLNYQNIEEKPEWRNPINFASLNTDKFEGGISILFDKNDLPQEIFFTSVRNQTYNRTGYAGLNLYHTTRNKSTGMWSIPVHLSEINSNFDDKMPTISPDGKNLIFSSNRPGGFGKNDLWISYRNLKTNTWSEPVNLGKFVNTSGDEIVPYYHKDGKSIFFSSNYQDENEKYSLYKSDYLNQSFYKPKKLQVPFNSKNNSNSGFSISKDGVWVYFASDQNQLNQGYDIFRAKLPEDLRNSYDYFLQGLILDGASKQSVGLETSITIYDDQLPKKIITSTRIDGKPFDKEEVVNFQTELKTGKFYRIQIQAPGYYPNEFSLDLRGNIGENKSKYIRVVLFPIQEEQTQKVEKVEKQTKFWFIKVIDKQTNQILSNPEITIFSDTNREGTKIKQNKITNLFPLEKIPKEDFELFVKLKGYVEETKKIQIQEINENYPNQMIEIQLSKIKAESIYGQKIYFEFNNSRLTLIAKEKLNKIVIYLKKNLKDNIEIGGHTDNVGSKEYNVILGQKRAEIVKQYLLSNGIDDKRIDTVSYWYSQPFVDNSTEENRAKNRRVGFKRR